MLTEQTKAIVLQFYQAFDDAHRSGREWKNCRALGTGGCAWVAAAIGNDLFAGAKTIAASIEECGSKVA